MLKSTQFSLLNLYCMIVNNVHYWEKQNKGNIYLIFLQKTTLHINVLKFRSWNNQDNVNISQIYSNWTLSSLFQKFIFCDKDYIHRLDITLFHEIVCRDPQDLSAH